MPIPNALHLSPELTITITPHQPAKKPGNGGITLQRDLESQGPTQSPSSRTRISRALSRLLIYNRPGNKELILPQRPLCFCDGERREILKSNDSPSNMAAFLNLLGKSKPAMLTSFYRREPNAAGGLLCGARMTCPTHLHEWRLFIHILIQ